MSSIINKVKDAVSGDKHSTTHHTNTTGTTGTTGTTSNIPEGTYGPHSSRMANAADPRVDSDLDNRGTTGATVGAGTGYTGNDNYTYGSSTTSAGGYVPEGTAGPHSSSIANKLDPRVDSDLDGSRTVGGTTGTTGISGGRTAGTTGAVGTTGASRTTGYHEVPEGTAGPHSSRIANKMDPRVDSDLDGSRTVGGTAGTTGHTAGTTGHTAGTTGHTAGTTGAIGTAGTAGTTRTTRSGAYEVPEGTAGPHSSRLANKMDPRVDSDLDGSRTVGGTTGSGVAGGRSADYTGTTGTTGTGVSGGRSADYAGTTGTTGTTGTMGTTGHHTAGHHTTGHHTTRTAGTTTGAAAGGVAGTGPGPAPNTAGPHKSDMLNKLDPRVDSDLDGSTTVGGNKTYST